MAEASVAARRKVLGAALCMSSVMTKNEESTSSKSVGGGGEHHQKRGGGGKARLTLKARLAELEEKIVREAAAREASCRNEDEERAIRIALDALRSNDGNGEAKARTALEMRLEHVVRRAADFDAILRENCLDDESDSDESDTDEKENGIREKGGVRENTELCPPSILSSSSSQSTGSSKAVRSTTTLHATSGVADNDRCGDAADVADSTPRERGETMLCASFWREVRESSCAPRALAMETSPAERDAEIAAAKEKRYASLKDDVAATGFFSTGRQIVDDTTVDHIAALMDALRKRNLPPVFSFMFSESWEVVLAAWQVAEAILGEECVLEPSIAAFHLRSTKPDDNGGPECDTGAREAPAERYVGTNFGIPHRDYSYADSATPQSGEARIVSVWVAINRVTVENGCMYVVPKNYDENFCKDAMYEHMQVCSVGVHREKKFLNFPLHGILPLPCAKGTAIGWAGNLIHWGSDCQRSENVDPRKSLAFVFRRARDAVAMGAEEQNNTTSSSNADYRRGLSRHDVDALRAHDGIDDTNDALIRRRLRTVMTAMAFFKHWYSIPTPLLDALRHANHLLLSTDT